LITCVQKAPQLRNICPHLRIEYTGMNSSDPFENFCMGFCRTPDRA